MSESDVTVVYANDAFTGTWPVFKVCLVVAPIGLLLLWYSKRIIDRTPYWPMGRFLTTAYWTAGILGAIAGAGGGFFGLIAFIVLECNGLSHWWLVIPGAVLAYALWRVERQIGQRRSQQKPRRRRDQSCKRAHSLAQPE